jgi:hypothetical protein
MEYDCGRLITELMDAMMKMDKNGKKLGGKKKSTQKNKCELFWCCSILWQIFNISMGVKMYVTISSIIVLFELFHYQYLTQDQISIFSQF